MGQKEEKENILNFSIFYQEQTQAKNTPFLMTSISGWYN